MIVVCGSDQQALANARQRLRKSASAAECVLTVASAGRLRERVELGRSQLGADLTQGVPQAIALGAHHLLDTKAGPSFPIFEDNAASAAGTVNSFGVEVLQPYGQFAIRRAADDEWLNRDGVWDDDDPSLRLAARIPRTGRTAGSG